MNDPAEAAQGADVLYTDVGPVWGQEDGRCQGTEVSKIPDKPVPIVSGPPEAIVMHCLPAKRGKEITDEVMDGSQSVVFDEAENRLHAHKAIMALTM